VVVGPIDATTGGVSAPNESNHACTALPDANTVTLLKGRLKRQRSICIDARHVPTFRTQTNLDFFACALALHDKDSTVTYRKTLD
jgi:hypothetical protein